MEAFARDKRESLRLAVRARLIALGVIAVLLLFLVPLDEVIYYEVLLACFALIGLGQLKLGRVTPSHFATKHGIAPMARFADRLAAC